MLKSYCIVSVEVEVVGRLRTLVLKEPEWLGRRPTIEFISSPKCNEQQQRLKDTTKSDLELMHKRSVSQKNEKPRM